MDSQVHFPKRALDDLERWCATSLRKWNSIEYQTGLRSLPFGPYRVYYRALAERKTLELLKIWHGMRGTKPKS